MAAQLPGDGLTPTELVARVRQATGGRAPLAFLEGPDRVRSIGLVSGAAADHVHDAIALGLDAFLTGEPAERIMAIARENAIHVLAAGHHATETSGVQRLGEELEQRFGVRHVFVDVPNPI
jgi:putative NIF3 family GTP cyclohydrolase 1 type 2